MFFATQSRASVPTEPDASTAPTLAPRSRHGDPGPRHMQLRS
ncbi:MAG: hypothetical protein EDM05_55965 (plasmid) [Leptolyngbya sp. IPPAS B-1204]